MRYRKKKEILDFLDVSIIIHINHRIKDFSVAIDHNAYFFEQNGIELILIILPSFSTQILSIINKYPYINFSVYSFQNDESSEFPGKALNLGINKSSFRYILTLDPASTLDRDIVYELRYITKYYTNAFVICNIPHLGQKDKVLEDSGNSELTKLGLFVEKEGFLLIKGLLEYLPWTLAHINLFRRLELEGYKRMNYSNLVNTTSNEGLDIHQIKADWTNNIRHLKNLLFPRTDRKFSPKEFPIHAIWNWNENKNLNGLIKFVNHFKSSYINFNNISNSYSLIALIQVRNEQRNIQEIIPHLGAYCDKIVLLDDGSEDNSYEKANGENILVKVKKEYKGFFDDLENRNILLKIASFLKSEWFLFIDADERFDTRYANPKHYRFKNDVDVIFFNMVDMWDYPYTYRVDMPKRSPDGIMKRARMFRNKGVMRINSNREIHFPAIPYFRNSIVAKTLLLHYGNYDKEIRDYKYRLYLNQDKKGIKQGHDYSYLKDDHVKLANLCDITVSGAE